MAPSKTLAHDSEDSSVDQDTLQLWGHCLGCGYLSLAILLSYRRLSVGFDAEQKDRRRWVEIIPLEPDQGNACARKATTMFPYPFLPLLCVLTQFFCGIKEQLGYKKQLHRTWHLIESFAASFCALNFIGAVRSIFFLGLFAGGPLAIWTSYLVTIGCMLITAAVLAEICSALPLSGSIYIWAAESANPKFARLVGFVVAWWTCTAWMTFVAGNCQTTANYLVSLLAIYGVDYPGGIAIANVKWRAFIWIISEIMLLLAIGLNYLPPKWYSRLFKFSLCVMGLDFLICIIWLPIGASRSYGIRSAHDAFMTTFNGTGATPGWNWILSFLFTAGTLTGFDAAGHIAEETKNASIVAARGIFTSAVATALCGFATTILFLFCTPDIEILYTLSAPQPFVQIYDLALGRGGAVFMTLLAVLGLILNTSIAIVAASRLIFAVARDGVLPWSGWIGKVTSDGQPRHAVTVMYIFAAVLLCVILPSQVAFTSLVSAGGVPTIAAYALISGLRLFCTPDGFKSTKFNLGVFRRPFYLVGLVFNLFILGVDLSPFFFPVTVDTFNFACLIFGSITIFALISWWIIPEKNWLRKAFLIHAKQTADKPDLISTETVRADGDFKVKKDEAWATTPALSE